MEYNDYIGEEQSIEFDYCDDKIKTINTINMIMRLIILIPYGSFIIFAIYMMMQHPEIVFGNSLVNVVFLIMSIVSLLYLVTLTFNQVLLPVVKKSYSKKIMVSEEGVSSQVNNVSMSWSEIKKISVGLYGLRKSKISYIYIQRDNFRLNYLSPKNMMYNDNLIIMSCTHERLDALKNHYNREIENIESYKPNKEKRSVVGVVINWILGMALIAWVLSMTFSTLLEVIQ